jgi:hypothetical protein
MINTVSDFVSKLGGHAKAADYFGVSIPAIYNWEVRGFPLWSHQMVRQAAQRRRMTVAASLLEVAKPERRKAKRRRESCSNPW